MLNQKIQIKGKTIKNRLLMPPLVCFNWADDKGYERVNRAKHYGLRAKGGAGIIVIEAAAISPVGRITSTELGIWEDGHIEQFKRIANACHLEDSLALVQIVHAGRQAFQPPLFSASRGLKADTPYEALTLEQIDEIINHFVQAAIRAEKAGLDGVEIHGAHGYLLNQFTAAESNLRNDLYGGSFEKRIQLSIDIVRAIKAKVSQDFIIGYRFGVNDPTLNEDIAFAKKLEQEGVDLLNVSAGIGFKGIETPKSFKHSPITYMGVAIQPHVKIPVACVFGIKKPDQAYDLVENEGVALVAVGKGFLADPQWGNKALSRQAVNVCADCAGGCRFRYDGFDCPWSKHWNWPEDEA